MVMGRKRVSARATITSAMTARNLPTTSWIEETGSVSSTSSVPERCSSLHWRIVSAATRNIISSGIQRKSGRTSAMPRAKNVSTQKKENRVTAKNAPTKMRAIGEPKYPASSLRVMDRDCFIFVFTVAPHAPVANSLKIVSSVRTSRRSSRSAHPSCFARS